MQLLSLIAEKKASYFFTQKLQKNSKSRRKKDYVMECMLNDARPTVEWFFNGEPIQVGGILGANH